MKQKFLLVFFLCTAIGFAQKKVLDHKDVALWNTIQNKAISNDGAYIHYIIKTGEKDTKLKLTTSEGKEVLSYERASRPQFTYNNSYLIFTIGSWNDDVLELKRKKTKTENMPKDTLAIFNLTSKTLVKIPNTKEYKLPLKSGEYLAYVLEAPIKIDKKKEEKEDKTENPANEEEDKKKAKKAKKVSKKNGYHLVVRNLKSEKQDTIKYVLSYQIAETGTNVVASTTGLTSKADNNVVVYNPKSAELITIHSATKGKYSQLSFDETGEHLGFVVDQDTTKVLTRPYQLFYWKKGEVKANELLSDAKAPQGYLVSNNGRIGFDKNGSKMYFGLRTAPIHQDTTLLKEEIVDLEVWTYNEPRLYTIQELQVKKDKSKSYTAVYDLKSGKAMTIANMKYPSAIIGDEGNASHALLSNPVPYQLESQWTIENARDIALFNMKDGSIIPIFEKFVGFVNLSPKGKFAYGYQAKDSAWVVYDIEAGKKVQLTKGAPFFNELNDSPRDPGSYGLMGWAEKDAAVFIYDRYDIWRFNPKTGGKERITKGRENKTSYRRVRLDREERSIESDAVQIVSVLNQENKHTGYAKLDIKSGNVQKLMGGAYRISELTKAKNANTVFYSKQTFEQFPDILSNDLSFKSEKRVSNANPQQSEYNWGTAELVKWTSLDGKELTGMLYKPENFDPNKKYPMIVNFYEKSSDRVFNHRAPSWGRSTINYSFYTSRGYIIFNPDVHYRIGYPGESAYNCVIPGVTSLIEKGFVDKDNIGVQGHSWGGYQIAYLVTKTDIFKAAESGAPVPNMISAYGGIRWETGLSRQFQYEHTQSRIGGTPWEYQSRYIENSPIFFMDKVNTPLLILHNDTDGHVPWYQGIEMFVALRRLGKPAWFLNYNGEPHWPLKFQNRKDFNIRLQQFFDYYLKGAPMPVWMDRGIPAVEKGINQGLELIEK